MTHQHHHDHHASGHADHALAGTHTRKRTFLALAATVFTATALVYFILTGFALLFVTITQPLGQNPVWTLTPDALLDHTQLIASAADLAAQTRIHLYILFATTLLALAAVAITMKLILSRLFHHPLLFISALSPALILAANAFIIFLFARLARTTAVPLATSLIILLGGYLFYLSMCAHEPRAFVILRSPKGLFTILLYVGTLVTTLLLAGTTYAASILLDQPLLGVLLTITAASIPLTLGLKTGTEALS